MDRRPEPELMDDPKQAEAYAAADFETAHASFVEHFQQAFPGQELTGRVLDLGCGPCDITRRFAAAFPNCSMDAVDGAANMLRFGREVIGRAGLDRRVRLIHSILPGNELRAESYDAVISNSLLHHLHNPAVLWQSIRRHARPGAAVFVMDLLRPPTPRDALALVETYAGNEPEILQRDFYRSLCAAFRPDEIRSQLVGAGLDHLIMRTVGDRHVVIHGRVGGTPPR
ncbi:MAG: SAM-dependent methyltransferase [Chromatiales bacterium 21-64-14]|nr:MAG: SAM-dependent methyltransferase [Chromatiales bacterium 21-64-14]HQU14530.1 class I SAM-dependent methyltransferase [Gammaproteobacteria bacterium]